MRSLKGCAEVCLNLREEPKRFSTVLVLRVGFAANCGSCVFLPRPVCPETMTSGCARTLPPPYLLFQPQACQNPSDVRLPRACSWLRSSSIFLFAFASLLCSLFSFTHSGYPFSSSSFFLSSLYFFSPADLTNTVAFFIHSPCIPSHTQMHGHLFTLP